MLEKSKILIVDDKEANLFSLKQILGVVDAEVMTTTSGNDALKSTLHHDFALIILDVQMPEMDGYELAELLRGKKETEQIPIMFLSAVYSSEHSLFKGYKTGAVDYLTKPVEPQVILNKVKTFVELDQQKKGYLAEKNKAQQADALKTRFLANMSHEIRTPMNAIIGFSDVMLLDELSPEHKEYLQTIKSSGKLLLRLIDDILDFSKIEANQLLIENQPFALEELVDLILSSAKMVMEGYTKTLELKVNVSPDISKYITSDKYRLHQILNNLLSNSIKFTEQGSIEINIGITQSNLLEFSVKDTGIGIAKDKINAIFDPFIQLGNNQIIKGTGLGLAITKKLTNLLGGEISIESEIAKGSTFTFTIPYEPAEPEVKIERKEISTTQKNILLVEDDEANIKLISKILSKYGYSFLIAKNGEEAITEYAKDSSINLILMDIQMPVMDGFAALKAIRELEYELTPIPIIALTAYAMKNDREKCIQAGFSDYLSKPVDRNLLLEMIEKY